MNQQIDLFYEDIYEALKAAVAAAGGAKAVAAKLWPHKSVEDGRRELLDALNRERARKLDVEEILLVLRLAKQADFHATKHFIDDSLGYQKTPPLNPKDEAADIQQRVNGHLAELRSLVARLERLGQSPLKAVV